jgi:phage major head subunit gpT-like protein
VDRFTPVLSVNDKQELANLNTAITSAIQARKDWLDKKTILYSPLQVGDSIYDIDSGIYKGIVTEIYRTFSGKEDDNLTGIYYQYETHRKRSYDNTSHRQDGCRYGTKQMAEEKNPGMDIDSLNEAANAMRSAARGINQHEGRDNAI